MVILCSHCVGSAAKHYCYISVWGSTVHKPNFRIPQKSPSGWKLRCFAARPGMKLVVTQKLVSTVLLVITVRW